LVEMRKHGSWRIFVRYSRRRGSKSEIKIEKINRWTEEKIDPILLPVISQMKRRSSNVHQTKIQTFFPLTEYFKPAHDSKRVQEILKDWHL
jgi:hypothetical protein